MISPLKLLLVVIPCLILVAGAKPVERVEDGVSYRILRVPADAIRVVWKDQDGRQLRSFAEAARHLQLAGLEVEAMMNGGIFEPGAIPSGLLVQDGKELVPVNRNDGQGNFFLKPNGIFLVGPRGAAVIATDEYPLHGHEVRQAIQSGPLLLRKGKIHHAFDEHSTSRLHRNGVGVAHDGTVVLAITHGRSLKFPNLHEFARLFRTLGCTDALFLDGDISQMRVGPGVRLPGNHFGSMIAVVHVKPADTKDSTP